MNEELRWSATRHCHHAPPMPRSAEPPPPPCRRNDLRAARVSAGSVVRTMILSPVTGGGVVPGGLAPATPMHVREGRLVPFLILCTFLTWIADQYLGAPCP